MITIDIIYTINFDDVFIIIVVLEVMRYHSINHNNKGVGNMAHVWAVSTNKGGVLKTSITTNLAGLLAKEGRKVLVVDTDNQGNVALSFGKNPDAYETTLYDVMMGEARADDAIVNVHENVDILPSNDDMSFLEIDILTEREKYTAPFSLLRNAIEDLRGQYDYILVDTPPNIGLVTGNVLSFVDGVVIPFQPETYSQRSLVKMLDAVAKFREQHNPNLRVLGVVGTLVDSRTSLHSDMLSKLRQMCLKSDIKCFDTIIPRSVRFASSVAYEGLPATLTDIKQPIVHSYYELLTEIKEVLK